MGFFWSPDEDATLRRMRNEGYECHQIAKAVGRTTLAVFKRVTRLGIAYHLPPFNQLSRETKDGCWEWLGPTISSGYGTYKGGTSKVLAHRYAYEQANGPIPDGLCICHHCDNKLCVNPKHLFLGTYSDNIQDMIRKGRDNRPLKYDASTLARVRALKSSGMSQASISIMTGISRPHICNILKGNRRARK